MRILPFGLMIAFLTKRVNHTSECLTALDNFVVCSILMQSIPARLSKFTHGPIYHITRHRHSQREEKKMSAQKPTNSAARFTIACFAVCILILLAAPIHAQDIGTPDTCRYDPAATIWHIDSDADSVFSIELWAWTDAADIKGASLGFRLTTSTGGGLGLDDSLIAVDTFIFSPETDTIPFAVFTRSVLDPTIYPGSADWGYNGYAIGFLATEGIIFLPSTPTKLGDLYLKIVDLNSISDTFEIAIDSSYFPPAGPFKFSPGSGSGFPPQFVNAVITVQKLICIDSDGDGFGDPGHPENDCPDDNCPFVFNPAQEDADSDGIGDSCDICPNHPDDDCCNPTGSNESPVITSAATVNVQPGETFLYTATASDPNCDGSELAISFADYPSWCSITEPEISGTAECDYMDTSFTVIAFDGDLAGSLTVALLIDKSNQPPVIDDPGDTVTVRNQAQFVYFPTIIDPDDTSHTIGYPEIPHWCAVQNDSVIGVAPDTVFIEPLTVTVHDYCNADTLSFFVSIYLCGDADGSGLIDIDDVVFLINYIFAGGPAPDPYEQGDADCSGLIDIDDAVYLIQYIFAGGPSPCADCP